MTLKQTPNIVNLIDYLTEENSNVTTFYILMEYCSSKKKIYKVYKFFLHF